MNNYLMNKVLQKPIYIANWKMHFTSSEVNLFFDKFLNYSFNNKCIGFAVPAPYLSIASNKLNNSSLMCGAQNMHWALEGAFTGEVSPLMLNDLGISFSLIGHSERRTYFGETNETIAKKIKVAIDNSIIPVFCIGETKEEFEAGKREEVISSQIFEGLSLVESDCLSSLIIAYEPVWAIGTGLSASPEDAESAHKLIKNLLKKLVNNSESSNLSSDITIGDIPVLYGGSVKEDNAQNLIEQENIDGFLVGGASLKPESFIKICSYR